MKKLQHTVTNSMIFIAIVLLMVIQAELVSINQSLQERTAMDSLYIDHLKECSMIRKDQIQIDSEGYIISTYHKEYLK